MRCVFHFVLQFVFAFNYAQTLGFCFALIMRKHLAFVLFASNHKGSAQTAFLHEERIESYFLNIFSFDFVDRHSANT